MCYTSLEGCPNRNICYVLGLKIQLGKNLELLPEKPGRFGNENTSVLLTQSRFVDLAAALSAGVPRG